MIIFMGRIKDKMRKIAARSSSQEGSMRRVESSNAISLEHG